MNAQNQQKIITNARHWRIGAFAIVRITKRPGLTRAKLTAIIKDADMAARLTWKTGNANQIVLITAETYTPEAICAKAVQQYEASGAHIDETGPAAL